MSYVEEFRAVKLRPVAIIHETRSRRTLLLEGKLFLDVDAAFDIKTRQYGAGSIMVRDEARDVLNAGVFSTNGVYPRACKTDSSMY